MTLKDHILQQTVGNRVIICATVPLGTVMGSNTLFETPPLGRLCDGWKSDKQNKTKVFLNLPVFHGVAAQNCSALFCDFVAKFACSNTSVLILTLKKM